MLRLVCSGVVMLRVRRIARPPQGGGAPTPTERNVLSSLPLEMRTHAQPSVRSLHRVELFRDLPEAELLQIAARLKFRSARRGTQIYRRGGPRLPA